MDERLKMSQFPIPKFNPYSGQHAHYYSGGRAAADSSNRELARIARQAPRIPWDIFLRDWFTWRNEDDDGEHVSLLGNTGGGKTHLMRQILPLHPFVTIFATKPRDRSMDAFLSEGYYRIEEWQKLSPMDYPRRVLWPRVRSIDAFDAMRETFRTALHRIYAEGAWTVATDELLMMTSEFKLDREYRMLYTQGRSLGISMVSATQRPRNVPLETYSQATHLFLWKQTDQYDLQRLSEIGGIDSSLLKSVVPLLGQHEVLYCCTKTGAVCRTKAPPPTKPTKEI